VEEAVIRWGDPFPIVRTIWKANFATLLRPHLAARAETLDPGLVACAREGLDMPAQELMAAEAARHELYHRVQAFFARYDLLLTPAVAILPLENGRLHPADYPDHPWDWLRWAPFSFPFNLTHVPAASVPAGFSRDGLPVGLQIVGPRLHDRRVLEASAAFEAARPWAGRRPPV
jgi:aspartyl-tRNA(Asn)/glutamyl-tRNA(Gln) amidotransferase subunit A